MSSVDKELKVYKRALELACHYMEYEYPKKNDDIYYRKERELEMIFKNKAKEELEEQKMSKYEKLSIDVNVSKKHSDWKKEFYFEIDKAKKL